MRETHKLFGIQGRAGAPLLSPAAAAAGAMVVVKLNERAHWQFPGNAVVRCIPDRPRRRPLPSLSDTGLGRNAQDRNPYLGELGLVGAGNLPPKGASINDIRKIFGFSDPQLFTFGSDSYYKIHTPSLTASAFP